MKNLRLLGGLLSAFLSGYGVCAQAPSVMTLEQIFESAEANSARLRPSFTAIDEADRDISIARSGYLPDINASLSVSYIGDGFTTRRGFTDYQRAPIPHLGNALSINITQPVYTGGEVSNSIVLARLKSTAARFAADFNRDNLRFQLAGYYLDLYKYCNLRSVFENNLSSARKMLADMQARYEQGVALLNDITRYELLVSNLELRLTQLENTLKILNNNLVTLAGLPPLTSIVPDTTIINRSLPTDDLLWWQDQAKCHSSSLALARSEVEMCRVNESLVMSQRLPKIGLQAGWNIDGPILVEIPPVNRNLSYWYVGVGVSYNLSSLYKTNRLLTKSRLSTVKAAQSLADAEENLLTAVNADHLRYLEAYEVFRTQLKSVELAERNYNVVATRYSAGLALITDLLDAADSRLEAQQQLVNTRINIIYCYYKLLFISGKI